MAIAIERIGSISDQIGEGPVWNPPDQLLYWIDGGHRLIRRMNPHSGEIQSWTMPDTVVSLAPRDHGGVLVAMHKEICLFDFEKESITWRTPCGDSGAVLNDGKVDRRGRFLFGSRDHDLKLPIGSIYSLDANLQLRMLAKDEVICSNGPCWSPDNRTFYFSDSIRQVIYAYDYDLARGTLGKRRIFADVGKLGGQPDGCTVDVDGRVWSANCYIGKIACFAPDGKLEELIEVPPPLVTSVSFGGPNLDVLYVTSIGLKVAGYESPANGGLFAITGLKARGLPETCFAG